MSTKRRFKNKKRVKRDLRRLTSILLALVLFAGVFPSSLLSVYAEKQSAFRVEIDGSIAGNISVSLTETGNPSETQTQSVSGGVATFYTFVDVDKTYDIDITGMTRYENYHDTNLTPRGTSVSFTATTPGFKEKVFSITTNYPVVNGEISTTETDIPYGSRKNIVATAVSGYVIADFIVDGNSVLGAVGEETYTQSFDNIIADHTVNVTFVPKTWEATVDFNSDGTIKGGLNNPVTGGKITANEGDSPSFIATADCVAAGAAADYHIASVKIDDVEQIAVAGNSPISFEHTFTNISANHSVTVVFTINTFDVTIEKGENGTVKYNGSNTPSKISVPYNGEPFFEITPNSGYTFSVSVDDAPDINFQNVSGSAGTVTYTAAGVTENQKITISFDVIPIASGEANDYFDITFSRTPLRVEETAIAITYFLPYDGTAILSSKGGYDGIKIRSNNNYTKNSITIREKTFIDRKRALAVAKKWEWLSFIGWKHDLNINLQKSINIVIDKEKPVIDDIPVQNWTNTAVSLSGTVTDTGTSGDPSSGIAKVVWSRGTPLTDAMVRSEVTNVANLSGSNWAFSVSGEQDSVTYYVYAMDEAENVSTAKTVVVKIDIADPEITNFMFRKIEPPIVSKIINFLTFGTFYNDAIEVVVSARDTGVTSLLKEITLYSNGAPIETKAVSGNSATFRMTLAEFNYNVVSALVKDNAGNTSDEKKPTEVATNASSDIVSLKTEKPTLSIVPTSGAQYVNGEENWYSGNVGFNVSASTESVGLYSVTIKVNGQNISTDKNGEAIDADFFESPTMLEDFLISTDYNPVDGENIIEVVAVNNCGGEITASIKVYIDTTNPKVVAFNIERENGDSLSKILNFLTFGNFFNEKVRITAIADDRYGATSGISTITLYADGVPIDGSPKSVTAIGDGTYQAEFVIPQNVIPNSTLVDIALTVVAADNVVNITGKDASHPDGVPITPTSVNSDLKSDRLLIETINPVISITAPGADFIDGSGKKWYPDDVLFTVTAHDEDAGIRSAKIKINDVEILIDADRKSIDDVFYTTETHTEVFRVNTNQGTCAEDGSYLIEVTITDNAGNTYSTSDIVYKDIDNPVITDYRFIPATSDGIIETSEFINSLEFGFYFKTEFTAIISVSDQEPSSGLDRISYRLVSYQNGKQTGEKTGTQIVTDGMAPISIPKGFKGQIFAEAFDNTKNKSDEVTPQGFVIDDVSPEINITNNTSTDSSDSGGNKLYVSDMSFTVVVSDYDSGLKEIGYFKSAEQGSFERKSTVIGNIGYRVGDALGDGWTVTEMDSNLVTKATKTFTFTDDDNDIVLTFDAYDRSGNHQKNVRSEKITVDKTNPIIHVVFRDDNDDDIYYDQNRIADIIVTERNFDSSLIMAAIENTFGKIPTFSFAEVSNSKYTAVIDFNEGDYTFDVSGTDLGNHEATVNFSGGNEKLFRVDKTKPVIEENFIEFEKNNLSFEEENNSFHTDKTVHIKITEHNFDPALVNLSITKKDAGEAHNSNGFVDVTSEILGVGRWEDEGDVHIISFTFDWDAVYQVEIKPTDLAGNAADRHNTVVFEIDKTVPIVTRKNDLWVSEKDTEFLDVYPYSRKDDPEPTVEFDDLNIDHIEYSLTVYIPDNSSPDAITVIKPVKVYLKEDTDQSGTIGGNLLTLPDFVKDGIYALELTAVDVAGNKSLLNLNTYARMIEQDVLAYILESNLSAKTGLYSFQSENGEAISKRPDNFSDVKIFVLAKKGTDNDIVLRDNNADEVNTYAQFTMDDNVYGYESYNFTLKSSFFKENFQDDTDIEMHLTVKNDGNRIDLGKMHIDNIAPTCEAPKELSSWRWFYGEEERTITVSNISELIDENQCKVYDNGKEVDFQYLSADNTISFTLGNGWHDVGITLDDMAGNAYNLQEKSNIHIGFFWLWMIIASSILILAIIAFVVIRNIRNRRKLESE